MHLRFVKVLNDWDPFQLGEGSYDTEIADTIQAMHDFDSIEEIAKKIQEIYEFSFEEVLAYDKCLHISKELMDIKESSSCSL
ncbi:YugE family protein [Bacillus sp. 03113]|uniref:YugE family protein n=1 Tax=Bacillus sp. 03113 TaxID=2578211 RepID=UPI00215C0039|nr:YugE family protein [Bacillus sp. 03113]